MTNDLDFLKMLRLINDVSNKGYEVAHTALFSIFLYDIAKTVKRKNIISVIPYDKGFKSSTKLAFLTLNKIFKERKIDCKLVWIGECPDEKLFKQKGYTFFNLNDGWQGHDALLHSSVVLYEHSDWITGNSFVRQLCVAGARRIYMGHGVPAKRLGYTHLSTRDSLHSFIGLVNGTMGFSHVLAESANLVQSYESYYPSAEICPIGSIRNDVFAMEDPLPDEYLLGVDRENYEKVLAAKRQGKKIILYAPTYRETGQDITHFLKSAALFFSLIKEREDIMLLVKLHPWFRSRSGANLEEISSPQEGKLQLADNEDLHIYLREVDLLITDYSSVYFDFLLLNRPVVFFQPDLVEYEAFRERVVYPPNENIPIGAVVKKPENLLRCIDKSIENPSLYAENRNKICSYVHGFGNDGKCGERLADLLVNILAEAKS